MDNYKKIRELGAGAFGQAFLVERKSDGAQFCLKEINVRGLMSEELNFAKEEAVKMVNLRQLNVVRYEDHWMDDNDPPEIMSIVMEYCNDGDLGDKIRQQDGCLFHERKIVGWFEQMCAAIKQCHDRQIVHRDLKAENFFLTKEGTRIKLGDFGVARILGSTTSGGVQQASTLAGTLTHMAPEVYDQQYDTKADIWSLGICLYHLCNLHLPFDVEGDWSNQVAIQGEMIRKIQSLDYKPLQSHFSKQLKDIVGQCLQLDPDSRPCIDTLQEMVDALSFDIGKSTARSTITPGSKSKSSHLYPTLRPSMRTKVNFRKEASTNEEKPDHKPPLIPPPRYSSKNTMPGGRSKVSVYNDNGKKRTALPMGVSCRHNGVNGTMSVIVEAKSLLANGISQNKIYSTCEDNQKMCTIYVRSLLSKIIIYKVDGLLISFWFRFTKELGVWLLKIPK